MLQKITACIAVVLILFSFISVIAVAASADANCSASLYPLRVGGGGSSGGGGGSGGGSSGGGVHHSGTGRRTTLLESVVHFIMTPIILFSSSILFYFKITKRARKSKKLMKQMLKSDNAWKYADISETVNDCYFAVQNAWAEMDMSPASQYLSDELFESLQTKLKWMAYRNEKNILKNIRLLQALPVAVHDNTDNARDFIWFYIKGKMIDYTINTDTQMKTDGNTSAASFVEYWQFTRKEDRWVLHKILQKNEADQIPFAD